MEELFPDSERYNNWMSAQNAEWEARCHRCGACCGSLEDPCENLQKAANGRFYCTVYDHRFGKWHTVSGKEFNCVPLREKLAQGHSWPGDQHCGYK